MSKTKLSCVLSLMFVCTGLLVFAFINPVAAKPSSKEVIKWDVAMWGPLGARVWPIQWWAEEMEKRTDGRFKAVLHPGGELSPPKQMLDGIRAGLFEMAHFCPLYAPGKAPLGMLFSTPCILPLGTKDIAEMELAFMNHPAVQKNMAKRWNAVYMDLSHSRPNYTFMGTKAVRSIEDLKGSRMRCGGKTAELFRKFGAAPMSVPAPEIYESLSRGTLDESFLAPASQYGYNVHEVADYYTYKLGAGTATLWCFVANKDAWESLPEDIQKTHKKLARELMLERLPKEMNKYIEEKIYPEWKKAGIEFIEFPAEARAKLEKAAKPLWQEWAQEMEERGLPGKEVLNYMLQKKKELEGDKN